MKKEEIVRFIDHTLLKPDATKEDIQKLCKEAIENNFYAVCVNPKFVFFAKDLLNGSNVKLACVVGFPLGENLTEIKASEAALAVADGADEIDMVISISSLISGEYKYVEHDIKAVVDAAKVPVKVIFETCKLTNEQIVKACELSYKAGASMVKTSTGFLGNGATVEAVKLMAENFKGRMGVKASGGIRDYETAMAMIEAGASRIGASSGIKIAEEAE